MSAIVDRIRNRISLDQIEVCIEGKELVFKCNLTDEKQLNLAAGKIHRGMASDWSLQASVLILKTSAANSGTLKLGKVHEAFKRMVT